MTMAYGYVLVAMLFPYFFTVLAKSESGFNNKKPREYLQSLTGWRKRAHWVQLNSLEIFPAFAIAMLVAHHTGVPVKMINLLGFIFLCSRVMYAICYLVDQDIFRSLFWGIGLGCIIGLFFI